MFGGIKSIVFKIKVFFSSPTHIAERKRNKSEPSF